MVWGGISLEGCTNLHVIANSTLTAVRYQDEILREIVRPSLVQWPRVPTVARVCRQSLEDGGIDAIDWPSCSLDLNPMGSYASVDPTPPSTATDCAGPYTVLSKIMSCCDKSRKLDLPVISVFFFDFRYDLESSPHRVNDFGFRCYIILFSTNYIMYITVKIFNLNNSFIKI